MRNTVTHPLVPPTSCRIPFIILLLGRVREYITAETTAGQLAYSTFAKTGGIADMACCTTSGHSRMRIGASRERRTVRLSRVAMQQPRTFVIESNRSRTMVCRVLARSSSSVRDRIIICSPTCLCACIFVCENVWKKRFCCSI